MRGRSIFEIAYTKDHEKFEVAPGGIGFVEGRGPGPQFEGTLFVVSLSTGAVYEIFRRR